jgi:hypothetical protein
VLSQDCREGASAETLWLTAAHRWPAVWGLIKAVWLPFTDSRVAQMGRAVRTSPPQAGQAFGFVD